VLPTLVSQGFVEQEPDRRYRLSLEAFAVGAGFLRQSAIRRAATPALMRLTERVQTSSYLALWHHGKAVIVDSFPVPGMYNFHSEIGSMAPLHASAIGKALLAFRGKKEWERAGPLRRFTANTITSQAVLCRELERIRRNGYSTDAEEVVPGCRCVAAPVPNGRTEPLAAVSVSGPPSIISSQRFRELAGAVQETCFQIAVQLGHRPMV
jgi:IclR family acetate operon transcriptional repressor